MTDTTVGDAAPSPEDTNAEATPPAGPQSWPADARAEVEKLRRENASWRSKLREVEPLAAKAQQLEQAQKSEAQQLTERAETAERRAAAAELAALAVEVAVAKGLTAGQAKRLVGANREELEADAEELLESLPAIGRAARTPVEALKPGASPASEPATPTDMSAWMRSRAGR